VVTVRHQKIEGWMEAMTMDFPVREGEDLSKIKPGTHIRATVYVEEPLFSLGNLRPESLDK
jgi:Cu/Ag efflux protein CusF